MTVPSTPVRQPSSAAASVRTTGSSGAVGLASDRSPLQKLELELKRINEGEASDELIYRRLTQRHKRGSSRHERNKRPAQVVQGGDGAMDYPEETQAAPEEAHRSTIGEFISEHNPFHFHHTVEPARIQSPLAGLERLSNQTVAHLTLEDMRLDGARGPRESHSMPDFYKKIWSRSLEEAAESTLDSSRDEAPGVEVFDGPAEGSLDKQHRLHKQHDPEHPSHHHHPDHMAVPHTKEEREDALIMSYLRAIPARKVPDRKQFAPPLGVRCGPLLRYAGLRRDVLDSGEERETWRGSIMIVTIDESSNYSPLPSARIFVVESGPGAASVGPTSERKKRHSSRSTSRAKSKLRTGEKSGRYREVDGFKLHTQRGHSFWRFNIEVELSDSETKIAYRINQGPMISFWVPAKGQPMNIMFHSCNGFSMGTDPNEFSGADPLWNDVLAKHQQRPFHVMIGGGDQIYNDSIAKQTKHFQAWLNIKTPFQKSAAEFTPEMANELEEFYFERYCFWFAQGTFGVVNSQIPMVNIWDGGAPHHDIIDGFGSYPSHFNSCSVFTGLGAVAFKYYMLFQHQSTLDENEEHEPSWLLGGGPGPYITEPSRSVFMFLGRSIAFLGLDCRTERMKDMVIAPNTYDKIFARLRKEIVPGETKHLLVLLGVPAAYPRLVWLENLLTSRIMEPIKALSRMGILGGLVNNFNGGVELLDDLDDHWTAKNHKGERNFLIKRLQRMAAELSVRITILSGDVHLAGIGQFMSNPKLNLPKINDHRYMANVISSAIVNAPPPNTLADLLNKRNKVHHLDLETDEDMFPIFRKDVDDTTRSNKRLMARRNYCMINLFDIQNTSSSSLVVAPLKKSVFGSLRGKKNRGSGQSSTSLPRNVTLDGVVDGKETAGASELMKDSLQITIRVEIDQKNPSGKTKPYRFLIPVLNYDDSSSAGVKRMSRSI